MRCADSPRHLLGSAVGPHPARSASSFPSADRSEEIPPIRGNRIGDYVRVYMQRRLSAVARTTTSRTAHGPDVTARTTSIKLTTSACGPCCGPTAPFKPSSRSTALIQLAEDIPGGPVCDLQHMVPQINRGEQR